MSVKIICDSASDMTLEEAKKAGVKLVPLKTVFDGVEYKDGVDITSEEFYQKLDESKSLPSTSQVAPSEFLEAYKEFCGPEDELLVITMSSRLSGTAQSAWIAAGEFEGRVRVVDSMNVCAGERIILEYAIRLRDQGRGLDEIADELEKVRSRTCLVARLDTLEYLKRGGRLSKTAAIAGTVLNIKPVLSIEEGEVEVIGKARGSRQSNNLLNQIIGKKGGVDFSMPLMLAYSGSDDALLKGYIDNSRELWEGNTDSLPVTVVGSVIGTHAGPGAIGVAFFAKEK